jgi:holo-[acyl-carrier protein] synthase
MIFGVGTDIVEVARIKASLEEFGDAFACRILAEIELDSYHASNIKPRFLAKRFAAKEAFAKALGTGLRAPATLQNIAVSHDELGKPLLILTEELQQFLKERHIRHMHISISDEKNLAAAFVVLET